MQALVVLSPRASLFTRRTIPKNAKNWGNSSRSFRPELMKYTPVPYDSEKYFFIKEEVNGFFQSVLGSQDVFQMVETARPRIAILEEKIICNREPNSVRTSKQGKQSRDDDTN